MIKGKIQIIALMIGVISLDVFGGEIVYNNRMDNSINNLSANESYKIARQGLYKKSSFDNEVTFIDTNTGKKQKFTLSIDTLKAYVKFNKIDVKGDHVVNSISQFVSNEYTDVFEKPRVNVFDNSQMNNRYYGLVNASMGSLSAPMTFAIARFNDNLPYLDKRVEESRMYHSNSFTHKDYRDNKTLMVIAGGNPYDYITKDRNTINGSSLYFATMTPNIQVLNRNELIFVNAIYTNGTRNTQELNRSRASGMTAYVNPSRSNGEDGTSFAAPVVTSVAYKLMKLYPTLRYHQIKQILLTTCKNQGAYLSDMDGWGILDGQKASKGIANLNAGLIDEEKYFVGMPDRIYDRDGNTYFWLDVNTNDTIEFGNDIRSGLDGNGYSNEYTERYFNDVRKNYISDEKSGSIGSIKLNIQKVYESERRFYANVAQAGFRKAGKGTLVLSGKQLYTTPLEILDGSVILKNNSNAMIRVYKNSSLKIVGDNLKVDRISSEGELNFAYAKNLQINSLAIVDMCKINISANDKNLPKVKNLIIKGDFPKDRLDNLVKAFRVENVEFIKSLPNMKDDELYEDVLINDNKYIDVEYVSAKDLKCRFEYDVVIRNFNEYKYALDKYFPKIKNMPIKYKRELEVYDKKTNQVAPIINNINCDKDIYKMPFWL